MTNLIPTPRTDKNGRVVVRHMKPVVTSSGIASIPVPAVSYDEDAKRSLRAGAYEVFLNIVFNGVVSDDEKRFLDDGLHKLSSETLNKLIDWDDGINYARLWTVMDAMRNDATPELITDFVHLADMMDDHGIDETIFSDYVHGFSKVSGLCPFNEDGTYPQQRFEQCEALTTVLVIMVDMVNEGALNEADMSFSDEGGHWTPFIQDKELLELLLREDRYLTMKIINDRRILNGTHIKQLLEQEGKALADGVL